MTNELLTTFWFTLSDPSGPMGLGVTAKDLDDAMGIIRASGYGDFLDETRHIAEHPDPALLPEHVQQRMGPIVVRGLWYPVWHPTPVI